MTAVVERRTNVVEVRDMATAVRRGRGQGGKGGDGGRGAGKGKDGGKGKTPKVCFHCGGPSHYANKCPNRGQPQQPAKFAGGNPNCMTPDMDPRLKGFLSYLDDRFTAGATPRGPGHTALAAGAYPGMPVFPPPPPPVPMTPQAQQALAGARTSPATTSPRQQQRQYGQQQPVGAGAPMPAASSFQDPWQGCETGWLAAVRTDVTFSTQATLEKYANEAGCVKARVAEVEGRVSALASVHAPTHKLGKPIDSGASGFIVNPDTAGLLEAPVSIPEIPLSAFGGEVTLNSAACVNYPELGRPLPSLLMKGGPEATGLGVVVEDARFIQGWHPGYGFHLCDGKGDETPTVVHNKVPDSLEGVGNSSALMAWGVRRSEQVWLDAVLDLLGGERVCMATIATW